MSAGGYAPMNGAKGRARTLKRNRREFLERAKAAGVDVTDRAALHAFKGRELDELCAAMAAASIPGFVREARKSNRQAMLDFAQGFYTRADAERTRRDSYMAKARAARAELERVRS